MASTIYIEDPGGELQRFLERGHLRPPRGCGPGRPGPRTARDAASATIVDAGGGLPGPDKLGRMVPPLPGCWSCGAVPSKEDIDLRGLLQVRSAKQGGPWTLLTCGACGVEGVLGQRFVLAPLEAVGREYPIVASLLEGSRERELRRKAREWMERFGRDFRAFRGEVPSPPPPRAPRRPAAAGLPSTKAEARAVLGLADGADRKEIDAAFRRASRRCHPDLVAHLDEDFQRLAHDKFLRIKRAHEVLTR